MGVPARNGRAGNLFCALSPTTKARRQLLVLRLKVMVACGYAMLSRFLPVFPVAIPCDAVRQTILNKTEVQELRLNLYF